MSKTVVAQFSFGELKDEKVKFFTQEPNFFYISIFNTGGSRPFQEIFNMCVAKCTHSVRHVMVFDVYFPLPKIL